jgi:hypothetical protein
LEELKPNIICKTLINSKLSSSQKRGTARAYNAVTMKMIPFSSTTEFQQESQRAVRNTGFAESAVWAVFAASSVISILFSLSQITAHF